MKKSYPALVATAAVPVNRNKLISKIHVAATQLGLDDDTYRGLVEGATGKRSCAQCSIFELNDILKALKAAGFVDKKPVPGGKAHVGKIKELWAQLAAKGALSDSGDAALRAFVKRQTGVNAPEFLNPKEANKVIEGLKAWARRAEASP